MTTIFYAIIFFVIVMVIASVIQTLIYPPIEVTAEELPNSVQDELQNHFPKFVISKAQFLKVRNRYSLHGKIDQRVCRVKFDVTPDGELAEFEFEDKSGPASLNNKQLIAVSEVPVGVAKVVEQVVNIQPEQFRAGKTYTGLIGRENGYELQFKLGDFDYEVKVTESGRIVELEKESLV